MVQSKIRAMVENITPHKDSWLLDQWLASPAQKKDNYFLKSGTNKLMYINERAPLYLVQRIFRGYSSQDLWAMNDFIVKAIRKPLKAFIKSAIRGGYGVPSKLVHKSYPSGKMDVGKRVKSDRDLRKEWVSILKKIDRAFDLYYTTEIKGTKIMGDATKKQWEEMEEGFRLFGEYFTSLWS